MKLILYLPGSEAHNFLDKYDQQDLLEVSLQEYTPSELCRSIKEINPEKIFWLGLEDEISLEYLTKSLAGQDVSHDQAGQKLFQGYVNVLVGTHANSVIISENSKIRAFARINNISSYDTLEDSL